MGGLPTTTVNGFAVDPTNPNIMFAATRGGVFRSDDAGARWLRAEGPKTVAAVAVGARDPRRVFAATADGVMWTSADGGRQWTRR